MEARTWLKRISAIFVVGLLAYLAIGYLGDSCKVRVTVDNTYDYPISAFAQLNVSERVFRSSGVFTVPPHSTHVITWYAHAGSYGIYVNWGGNGGNNTPDIVMGGSEFYYYWEDFYLIPFATKNFVVEPILGAW